MNELVQNKSDKRRRWFGLLYLLISGILLIWGTTWLEPYLVGWKFVLYWFVCFLTTIMAMLIAMLDIWIIRIRARQQRRNAANDAFKKETDAEEDSKRE